MSRYKYLNFFIIILLLFSCKNEQDSAPENNSFSYLESKNNQTEQQGTAQQPGTPSDQASFTCPKIHTELIGDIITKNTGTDYVKSNVLSLSTPYTLECSNNNKLTVGEIILNIPAELNADQYMGGTVIAIGEIGKSSANNSTLPVEMNVIRLEVTKGSIK